MMFLFRYLINHKTSYQLQWSNLRQPNNRNRALSLTFAVVCSWVRFGYEKKCWLSSSPAQTESSYCVSSLRDPFHTRQFFSFIRIPDFLFVHRNQRYWTGVTPGSTEGLVTHSSVLRIHFGNDGVGVGRSGRVGDQAQLSSPLSYLTRLSQTVPDSLNHCR